MQSSVFTKDRTDNDRISSLDANELEELNLFVSPMEHLSDTNVYVRSESESSFPLASCCSWWTMIFLTARRQLILSWSFLDILLVVLWLTGHGLFIGMITYNNLESYNDICKGFGRMLWVDLTVVFLLALKNNPLYLPFRTSAEQISFWHKSAATWFFLMMLIHLTLGILTNYGALVPELLLSRKNAMGSVAGLLYFLLFIFSLPFVRRRAWELFRFTHLLAIPATISLFFHHKGSTYIYIYLPILLGTFVPDISFRLWNRFCSNNPTIRSVDATSSGIVKLEIGPFASNEWHIGGHVYLSIPQISYFQQHPFSIAPSDDPSGITLHIRTAGGWTSALHEIAMSAPQRLLSSRVTLEGPYGGLSYNIATFKRIILVAGGVGLSPMLNVLASLKKHARVTAYHPKVTIIWSIRSIEEIHIFNLGRLFDEEDGIELNSQDWQVYITGKCEVDPQSTIMRKGRPPIRNLFEAIAIESLCEGINKAAVVITGPVGFMKNVEKEVQEVKISPKLCSPFEYYIHCETADL